jgi:hypothetical protein
MKALARELVALEPNVIVVISTPVTAAVMQETHTIPIAIQPIAMPIRDAGTIENAIEAFACEINPGLLVLPDVTTTVHEELIVKLAVQTSVAGHLPMASLCYRRWSDMLRGRSS